MAERKTCKQKMKNTRRHQKRETYERERQSNKKQTYKEQSSEFTRKYDLCF